MDKLRKMVWAEGVLLGQQHFQQWENFFNQQHVVCLQAQSPFAYGLTVLSIDEEA